MTHRTPPPTAAALLLAAVLASGAARAEEAPRPVFSGAPIACGANVPFKDCKATFDGWSLSIAYSNPEGPGSLAVYRKCAVHLRALNCSEGEWRMGRESGPLGGVTIALKDGLPLPR